MPKEIDGMCSEFESKNEQRFHMRDLVSGISDLIGSENIIIYCANLMKTSGCIVTENEGDLSL